MAKKRYELAVASSKSEYDWQAEDDLRTLCNAREIKKDPKRLKRAQDLAKKKMTEVASIAGDSDD